MEKNYAVSDLHLFHSNIIKYCNREDYIPITKESTLQMNWDIVNSINEQTPDEEGVVLWNLGDLFYGKLASEQTLSQLQALVDVMKGEHRTLKLVLGNHDRQFKKFAQWKKLYPLNDKTPLPKIYEYLGFDEVYTTPIIVGDHTIISHEPFCLSKTQDFINIHGHTHDELVDEKYFVYNVENLKMVRRAYSMEKHSKEFPPVIEAYPDRIVDPNCYLNICWDNTKGKVVDISKYLN